MFVFMPPKLNVLLRCGFKIYFVNRVFPNNYFAFLAHWAYTDSNLTRSGGPFSCQHRYDPLLTYQCVCIEIQVPCGSNSLGNCYFHSDNIITDDYFNSLETKLIQNFHVVLLCDFKNVPWPNIMLATTWILSLSLSLSHACMRTHKNTNTHINKKKSGLLQQVLIQVSCRVLPDGAESGSYQFIYTIVTFLKWLR
jgi:hypothetical protein